MRRSIEKLVDIGPLMRGSNVEIAVVYEIEVFQGNPGGQPGIQEIEGHVDPIEEGGDLADLVGKELTLVLRDGRTLRLSLTDAEGHFKAKGPIENS